MGFLNDATFGRYIYRESLIHHLDPRVKLVCLFIFGLEIVLFKDTFPLLLLSLFLILSVKISKIPFRVWFKGFFIFLWLFLIIILFYILGPPSGNDFLLSLKMGLLIVIRWAIMIGFCTLLTMTTTPLEISHSLESLLNPLNKLKVPIHDLSIMWSLTIHFFPLIKEEVDRIIKARMVQGMDLRCCGFTKRIHNVTGIISPLIHRLYRRSEKVALAMEARGFYYKRFKGDDYNYPFEPLSKKDICVLFSVIIFLITLWGSNFIH